MVKSFILNNNIDNKKLSSIHPFVSIHLVSHQLKVHRDFNYLWLPYIISFYVVGAYYKYKFKTCKLVALWELCRFMSLWKLMSSLLHVPTFWHIKIVYDLEKISTTIDVNSDHGSLLTLVFSSSILFSPIVA